MTAPTLDDDATDDTPLDAPIVRAMHEALTACGLAHVLPLAPTLRKDAATKTYVPIDPMKGQWPHPKREVRDAFHEEWTTRLQALVGVNLAEPTRNRAVTVGRRLSPDAAHVKQGIASRARVMALHAEGKTDPEIIAETGLSRQRVGQIRRIAGLAPNPSPGSRDVSLARGAAHRAEIAARIQRGQSHATIAADLQLSRSYISRAAILAGVRQRHRARKAA